MEIRTHINLSLKDIQSEEMLRLVSNEGLYPELFIDGNEIENISRPEIGTIREGLERFGLLPVTIHAPFQDLSPGSIDNRVREISMKKISKAVDIARDIPVAGIVVHSGYNDWFFDYDMREWLDRASGFFSELCERSNKGGSFIFVENIFEKDPDNLLELKEKVGSEKLKFCFDPGHAALFSSLPPVSWLKTLGEHTGEVHLHDNSGKRDEHLPLLEGSINFRGILFALKELGINPILTLEPHTLDHARRTVRNLTELISEVYGD